jgi:hypothetical protein
MPRTRKPAEHEGSFDVKDTIFVYSTLYFEVLEYFVVRSGDLAPSRRWRSSSLLSLQSQSGNLLMALSDTVGERLDMCTCAGLYIKL